MDEEDWRGQKEERRGGREAQFSPLERHTCHSLEELGPAG